MFLCVLASFIFFFYLVFGCDFQSHVLIFGLSLVLLVRVDLKNKLKSEKAVVVDSKKFVVYV